MSNFTLQVTVQVDVQNAESIQQARESVFALLSAPKETKQRKGRPTATLQTKATVTGVQIPLAESVVVRRLTDEERQQLADAAQEMNCGTRIVTETAP